MRRCYSISCWLAPHQDVREQLEESPAKAGAATESKEEENARQRSKPGRHLQICQLVRSQCHGTRLSEMTRVAPPPTGSGLGHCEYRPEPSV